MNRIKLIAIDVDHTLLTEQGELPPRFFEYVRVLDELGINCAISSGRPLYTLNEMFSEVWGQMSFVCDNGGLIIHRGKTIFESLIHPEQVRMLARFAEEKGEGVPLLCATDAAYLLKKHQVHQDYLRRFYSNIICVDAESLASVEANVDKFTVYYPNKNCHPSFYSWYAPTFGSDFAVALCDTSWIDIMNKGVDKGAAMRILGEVVGASSEQMMAFGDSYNDIPMLEMVKYSYVMKNAVEDMRQYAHFLAESNDDYGVLKVFDEVIALSRGSKEIFKTNGV
ncbi:MAG: HAD family hydrolase [Hydrogenoanaerobacterium sp.]